MSASRREYADVLYLKAKSRGFSFEAFSRWNGGARTGSFRLLGNIKIASGNDVEKCLWSLHSPKLVSAATGQIQHESNVIDDVPTKGVPLHGKIPGKKNPLKFFRKVSSIWRFCGDVSPQKRFYIVRFGDLQYSYDKRRGNWRERKITKGKTDNR